MVQRRQSYSSGQLVAQSEMALADWFSATADAGGNRISATPAMRTIANALQRDDGIEPPHLPSRVALDGLVHRRHRGDEHQLVKITTTTASVEELGHR